MDQRIAYLTHTNNGREKKMTESEWEEFRYSEMGKFWKVKKIVTVEKEVKTESNYVPPEMKESKEPIISSEQLPTQKVDDNYPDKKSAPKSKK